jgi:hypothetical protein
VREREREREREKEREEIVTFVHQGEQFLRAISVNTSS